MGDRGSLKLFEDRGTAFGLSETTPNKWLTMQRVLHARRLLEDTALSVDGVADESGFGSAALLRHHFNKVVGVAPKDYRRTFGATRNVSA